MRSATPETTFDVFADQWHLLVRTNRLPSPVARLKLDPSPAPELVVIGISSHVHPHRLCWSLNNAMGLELSRRADLVDTLSGHEARFAAFEQTVPPDGYKWCLVNNHGPTGILLKEQRHADYFLVLDPVLAEDRPDLLDSVRQAAFVLTAFEVPYRTLRFGHKLLL